MRSWVTWFISQKWIVDVSSTEQVTSAEASEGELPDVNSEKKMPPLGENVEESGDEDDAQIFFIG